MKTKNKTIIMMILLTLFMTMLTNSVLSDNSYNVKFNKNTYDLGEEIKLTIEKPENTQVNLTYQLVQDTIIYEPVTINIHENEKIINITKSGTYKISTKLYNATGEINETTKTNLNNNELNVNTFELEIDVEKTIIPKNNNLKLIANSINNQGATSYTWSLNDGTGEIKTGKEITHNFPNTGSHKVKVIAKDYNENENEAEVTITVQDAKIIWVEVRSDATDELIENAKVDFGSVNANTDNLGRALFYLPTRTYILEVSKNQYKNTRQYVDVTKDATYTIYLGRDRKEYNDPVIIADTLLKNTINDETATLKFEIYDESATMCEVYVKRKDSAWKYVEQYEILGDMKVYETIFKNLKPTRYDWRIDCEDSYGNREMQESYFYVDYEYTQDEQEQEVEEVKTLNKNHTKVTAPLLNKIDKIKEDAKLYSDKQKKVSTLLNQITELNIIEKEIRAMESELYKIRQDGTESEFDIREAEIKDELEEKSSRIINNIEITETKNIENENSQELYELHQKNTGKIISESNIKTEALQIRTDSISGNSEYYVLVTHTGFNSNDALTISFESEFVKDRSELYTSNNMKLIEDDLIIEFAPNNNKEISYYVKGISTLDNINNLEYVNTKPNVKNSQTTGFSISNTTDLIKNNFLFVLIGLLFMVYVFYNFEVGDKIKDVSVKTINRMQNKNMTKDAKEMIQEIRDAKKIVNENLNDAKKTYSKVMINYQGLTGKEKEHVYHDAISLHKAILEKNMDEIMNHVDSHLDKGDKKSAKIYLERLEQLYNGLEPNLKEKLKYKVVLANMNYNSNKNNN